MTKSGRVVLDAKNTIKLAERFANSDRFQKLFSDGMTLVEECANYLDGIGRKEAKNLPRNVAMVYGSESMRMTTRLMQLASWLLLQRSSNSGDMTREQMLEEKKKVNLQKMADDKPSAELSELPTDFQDLVARSYKLQDRIIQLDTELYENSKELESNPTNGVSQQIDLLSAAFGNGK